MFTHDRGSVSVTVDDQLSESPPGELRKNLGEILWVAIPKIAAGALQLLFNFLFLQQFGPETFGVLSVCTTAILLIDAICGSAVDMGVVRLAPVYRSSDVTRSIQIQQAALFVKPVILSVLAIPLVLQSDFLHSQLFKGTYVGTSVLLFTFLAVIGLVVLRSIQTHFQVEQNFRAYGMTDLVQNTIRYGGVALLLWSRNATAERILALYAAAPLIASMTILQTSARQLLLTRFNYGALTELVGVIKWYVASTGIGSLVSRMDLFFVSSFSGIHQAGLFSAGQVVALIPQLLGMYASVVFSSKVMDLYQKKKLGPLYRKFQVLVVFSSIVLYLLLLLSQSLLKSLVLPVAYQESLPVILVLVPAGLCSLVNFPWTIPTLLFLRPRFLFIFDLSFLPALCALYVFAAKEYGAFGVAVVTTGFALVKALAYQIVCWRLFVDQSKH